jgi:hypothetical protein
MARTQGVLCAQAWAFLSSKNDKSSFLIPGFDGAFLSHESKDALWDKFYTSARALTDWLKQVIEKLGHKKRRQMCPLYVTGLFKPGERKSIEPSHCPGVGTVRLPI